MFTDKTALHNLTSSIAPVYGYERTISSRPQVEPPISIGPAAFNAIAGESLIIATPLRNKRRKFVVALSNEPDQSKIQKKIKIKIYYKIHSKQNIRNI
jgi:hypothetical protein